MATTPDDLAIHINGHIVTGWTGAKFTCGIERFPRAFSVSITERLDQNYKALAIFEEGMPITVHLGDDKVMTGYIDVVNAAISAQEHTVSISGRSMCEDLVDCSADIAGMSIGNYFNTTPASVIATRLAAPYGIKVQAGENSKTSKLPLNINLGETVYQIIERIARYSGFLVYDNEDGDLILSEPASEPKAQIVLKQGVNIKHANTEFNLSERFGSYEFYSHSAQTLLDTTSAINHGQYGPDNSASHGYSNDAVFDKYKTPYGAPRVRKLIQIADLPLSGAVTAQTRANWELNRRAGRSQRIEITKQGWRDDNGKLFRPNSLVDFHTPSIRLSNKTWLIADLIFEKGLAGTTTQLVLMPKEAFEIEPYLLAPIQADLQTAIEDSKTTAGTGGVAGQQ